MALLDLLLGPLTKIIDKVIPDPQAREAAKLELLRLQGSHELALLQTQMSAIVAEAQAADPWTSRARPSFLYVMYALILWALPMGLIAATPIRRRGHRARDDRIPECAARTTLCAVRHRLPRLHSGAPVGQGQGHRPVTAQNRVLPLAKCPG